MTIYPHRIRLRGPWECEPAVAAGAAGPPRRVTVPCHYRDVGLAGAAGPVRFRRRFGYPGRIDEGERVWLTLAGWTGRADIALNGEPLAAGAESGPREFDVTGRLRPRNELDVVLDAAAPDAGLWGEVALEVRRTAYLRDVTGRRSPDPAAVGAAGQVVGGSDRPLDLYLLAGGRNLAHTMIRPSPGGTPFALEAAEPDQLHGHPAVTARVELVDGGVVWYAVEVPCLREVR